MTPRTMSPLAGLGLILALAATPLTPGCAATDNPSPHTEPAQAPGGEEAPPGFDASTKQPWSTFIETAPGSGVWIGGQPSDAALDEFAARGGSSVINLKTDAEMAGDPTFADRVESRGMRYIAAPTAPESMGPMTADAFAEAMALAQLERGPVLVHCQASGRALYAVAMDRVRRGEMTPTQAIAWARWMRSGRGWGIGEDALRAVGVQRGKAARGAAAE